MRDGHDALKDEYDVVIVGSGASGLTAATVAAQQGLEVLVVEKSRWFGGTTAFSGGVAWIPNNHHMPEAGVEDSRERALEYLKNVLGNHYDAGKIEAYVDAAPVMLRHMEATTSLRTISTPTPDYEPDLGGANRNRGVLALEFDGRKLGADLHRLRRTRPELTVFESMQVAAADILPLRTSFRSPGSFVHTTRMLLRYGWQKLKHGRGTRLVSGNALAGRLLHSARAAGVALLTEVGAKELILSDGRVRGVVVGQGSTRRAIGVRRAVVLASGGFGANAAMRAQFMPLAEHHVSLQPSENVGDGVLMGVEAGGELVRTNVANAIFTPVSLSTWPDGTEAVFPHIMIDRYMPGSIAVGPDGRRFINEGSSYQKFVSAMHRGNLSKVYMIADRRFLRTYGMGHARPFPYPVRRWIRNKYLVEAPTLARLADALSIDPARFEETVVQFNEGARLGVDIFFQRGADAHSRFRGDQAHRPNPSLGAIEKAPFYAIVLRPGDLSSIAGLRTDARARVLRTDGTAIEGLYAAGLDMNSITEGFYPGGGASLGPAMTFGFIAAMDIAQGGTPTSASWSQPLCGHRRWSHSGSD